MIKAVLAAMYVIAVFTIAAFAWRALRYGIVALVHYCDRRFNDRH